RGGRVWHRRLAGGITGETPVPHLISWSIEMQIAQLAAEKRESSGTSAARRLRKTGKLPGIVYGHGQEPEPIAVPVRDLSNLVEHGAHLVELKVNGSVQQCLIKDVQ